MRIACIALGLCVAGGSVAAGEWTAAPDVAPGTAATQPAATSPGQLAMDPHRIKGTLAMAPLLKGDRELLVPSRPSKYVMTVATGIGSGWELWDLKLGQKEKEGGARLEMREPALSPDGQYLAGYKWRGRAGNGFEVWSLKTGKPLTIPVAEGGANVRVLGFAGNDRLVAFYGSGSKGTLKVHELATGKVTAETPLELPQESGVAFSATGRLVAAAGGGKITLVETATGTVLGRGTYAAAEKGMGERPWEWLRPSAAFSADGKELAVAVTQGEKLRVEVLSVATGQPVAGKTAALNGTKVPENAVLSFNPDGSTLLLGDVVIDRGTLEVVYQLPKREKFLLARWADPTHAVIIHRSGNRVSFEGVAVTKEEIAKTAAQVAGGGKVEDAALPPLMEVTAAGAVQVSMENAIATPWNVKPWEQPKVTKSVAASFNVRPGANMPAAPADDRFFRGYEDRVTAVLFTSREAHAVLVEHAAMGMGAGLREGPARKKTWVERHDLIAGNVTGAVEPPATCELMDASDSARMLAFRSGAEGDRVDVFGFEKGTFKPVAAFRPFGGEKGGDVFGTKPGRVVSAAFVTDTLLLAESAMGTLAAFDLSGGAVKMTWRAQVPQAAGRILRGEGRLVMTGDGRLNGVRKSSGLALSEDRRLGAVPTSNGLAVFDARTGQVLNGLPATAERLTVTQLAFGADGTRLAALARRGRVSAVLVFDLASGQEVADVPLPEIQEEGTFCFLSPGYLKLPGNQVLSLAKQVVLGRYELPGGRGAELRRSVFSPYDKFFYVVPKEGRVPAAVVSAALPHEEFVKAGDFVLAEALYVWHPGMRVKLEVNVTGDEAFKQQEVARWVEELKARGITVDEQSQNVLRANSFVMTGPATEYRSGSETASLPTYATGYEITLTVGEKEVWKSVVNKPPERGMAMGMISVMKKKGESFQEAVNREHPAPKTASVVEAPPAYIFKEREIPTARLGPKGVEAEGAQRGPVAPGR